jgi:uncharacterized protein YdeI (YjbR/CyaY-like superfamily)
MPEIGETTFVRTRVAWRKWLAKHHASKPEIWLVLLKKHVNKPCVAYDDAVEEALCFGWIDGILKRIDDEKHVIRFCPRRRNSVWSDSNRKRVNRMIRQGKMTEAGLAAVREAKRNGQWQKAGQPRTDVAPDDLVRALKRNRKARELFERLSPSHRRQYIGWIEEAAREETRKRRIRKTVERLAAGKKPGIDM